MAIKVNPPPQQKIPRKILEDKELRDYFLGRQEIEYKLWLRSGGGTDAIKEIGDAVNSAQTSNQAQLNEINNRLGSGDALTCDETGFTCDLTTLTCDMTEA